LAEGVFEFGEFTVDPTQRRLLRRGETLEVSSRYLDALTLMLQHPGQLIKRERFLDEVWAGVPVTDEALSQCITNLRRLLGDDAARPRFIETVPKHGYRFVAPVATKEAAQSGRTAMPPSRSWGNVATLAAAGAAGGVLAGIGGGFLYGLGASPDPLHPSVGATSFLLVMLAVNILAASIGGVGVGAGIGIAHHFWRPRMLTTFAGGAIGGLLIGGIVKLLGVDAFSVLLGRAPNGIGGGLEGLIIGGAVGLGTHLTLRRKHGWPSIGGAAGLGAIAGTILPLIGGRLMAASLDSLAETYPNSPINMDALGRWFGEDGFGLRAQIGVTAVEGLMFGACVALAIRFARRLQRERRA
jgi:DNA-binding winged helix-turn-helix (wHTH) protein